MDTNPTRTTYLFSKTIHEDGNGDGFFEEQTTERYALNGQLLYKVYEKRDSNNKITYTSQSNYTYDSQDYLASILTEIDQNNDGFDSTDYYSCAYDSKGNLLSEIFKSDKGNDDFIDYYSAVTNIYDSDNRLIFNETFKDPNGDWGNSITQGSSRIVYIYTYNANGSIYSKTYDTSGGFYGLSNYHDIYTYNYDSNGRVSSELSVSSPDIKGIRHPIPYSVLSHFTYLYNSEGKLTSEIKEVDDVNDGTIDSKKITDYIYDDNDRLISSIGKLYSKNNIVDDLSIEAWTYDDNGNLSSRIYEFDRHNDGVVDDRVIQEYTYDSMGNILSEIYRDETEYPKNGTIKICSALHTSYYYQPIVEPEPIIIPNPILEPGSIITPDPVVIKIEPTQPPNPIINGPEERPSPRLEDEPIDYRPVLLNLQDITGISSVAFSLNREAAFDNFVGFYKVTDEQGGLDINGDGHADLLPGDEGYAEAVLGNYEKQITLMVANKKTSVLVNELVGGSLYAPFLVANGVPQDPSSFKIEVVYFAFSAANRDGAEHIKLIDNHLCFEDWFGGGDNDFNDAVIQVTV